MGCKSLIKALQPFREMPSKDRRKRFAAGELYGDFEKPESHDVSLFEYWAIGTAKLQNAHCFLLGKIIFMSHLGKSCTSEMKTNPNLNNFIIMFNVYEYDSQSKCYRVNGRSGLLKTRCLIANVNNEVVLENEKITLDHIKVPELKEYLQFHDDIDIDSRLPMQSTASATTDLVDECNQSDPFIVDKIISKRFNSHKVQYEFLVSWIGSVTVIRHGNFLVIYQITKSRNLKEETTKKGLKFLLTHMERGQNANKQQKRTISKPFRFINIYIYIYITYIK